MRVVATPEASEFISAQGGVAYVRPLRRKCCGGAMTVLSATTRAPADAARYEPVGDGTIGVRYLRPAALDRNGVPVPRVGRGDAASGGEAGDPGVGEPAGPEELLIELRGRRHPRLVACWDGCLFKI
ncbi:MAG: hypothetical protein ABSH30_03185 [Acidimicrobiales bacterium]|jgi:hypothetical protein